MPDPVLTEESLQFGEGGRLSGILTFAKPVATEPGPMPVFIFFNAGSLHRVGPRRLTVQLARALWSAGFSSLRVDLAGKGDSRSRAGLKYQDSVAADFGEILRVVESRFGRVPLILGGLCSGADNVIRMTPKDVRVVGLLLLDPVCARDEGFAVREFLLKYTRLALYAAWIKSHFERLTTSRQGHEEKMDPLAVRSAASQAQLQLALKGIGDRKGRVLSVFTSYALSYYNQAGQLGRVSGVEGCQQFCTEVFWPQADHTFSLELYRRRLIDTIKTWAVGFIPSRIEAKD